jgi:hypothetical protein
MARVLFEKTTKFVEIKINDHGWSRLSFFQLCNIEKIIAELVEFAVTKKIPKFPKISCLKKMTNFIRKSTDHGWSKETPERREA